MCSTQFDLTRYLLEGESGGWPGWYQEGLVSPGWPACYFTSLEYLTGCELVEFMCGSFLVNIILKLCTVLSSILP